MPSPLPVVKGRYVAGRNAKAIGKQLSAHFKYAEHRKRAENETREDRFLFSQERDHVERKDAVNDVMSHSSRSVHYHKIIFSPGEHERIDDFRKWIRDQMRDLEEHKGIHLHWYGVVHAHQREQTSEPHVHVVLAGSGEDLHRGEQKTVRMDRDDYAFLREQGREQSNYAFYQELEDSLHDLDMHDTVGREQPERTREQPAHPFARLMDEQHGYQR
jgi:hypothetical protein